MTREHYDFSAMKAEKNPYIRQLRKPHTIQLDNDTAAYFRGLAAELGMPYRNFINLYLRECAQHGVKLVPQPLIETNPFKRQFEWDEEHLSTIEDFRKWFAVDLPELIYRGQACSAWPLSSTLDRHASPTDEYATKLAKEKELIQRFRKHGMRFLAEQERRLVRENAQGEQIGSMAVMRHFGAPTRLLDWSRSRGVAAYFACIGEENCDSAIWWVRHDAIKNSVDPHWENRGFIRRTEPGSNQVILDSKIFDLDVVPFVTLVGYPYPFPRMRAQHGWFTLATRFDLGHEQALEEQVPKQHRGRVLLKNQIKNEVLDFLEEYDINAHTLQHAGADQVGLKMAWEFEQSQKKMRSRATAVENGRGVGI